MFSFRCCQSIAIKYKKDYLQLYKMDFAGFSIDELCIQEKGGHTGRMGRRRFEDDDDSNYKSKNLFAERRRRQKLSERLLTLRSLVPIITNMNKATIIEDAVTYIEELQKTSKILSDQLLEMEGSSEEGGNPTNEEIGDAAEEMEKCGIKEEVEVSNIDGNKLLVKIIFQKRKGGFTRLIEAMNYFGLELVETNVTVLKGAMLVSSCVQGTYGGTLSVDQAKELLLDIISGL